MSTIYLFNKYCASLSIPNNKEYSNCLVFERTFKLFGQKSDRTAKMTYQPRKSLGLAHSLHQHHHFLFLGRECRKFLSNQGFDSLEKLHIISRITEYVTLLQKTNFHLFTWSINRNTS